MGRGRLFWGAALGVENISLGEILIVRYRHLRRFDALTIRGKVTATKKAKCQSRRDELDVDCSACKIWTGHLI